MKFLARFDSEFAKKKPMKSKTAQLLIGAMIVVAVCSFLLGRHMGMSKEAWRSAYSAHHSDVEHCLALGAEVNKRVKMAWLTHMPLETFKEEFGNVIPIDRAKFPGASEDATHVYMHEQSHRTFYLRFEAGALLGFASNHSPDDIQPYPPAIDERLVVAK
jgi:hypothetical protein